MRNRTQGQMDLIKKVSAIRPGNDLTIHSTPPGDKDFGLRDKDKGGNDKNRNPYRIQQMLQQREVNDLFTAAKLSTDRYQES